MPETRHDVVWRYLPGRPVKHALLAGAGPNSLAFCGRGPLWYAAPDRRWQVDEQGLAERRPCLRCVQAIGGDA